ncbi:MAG: S9 family peptidase [Nibricoccus sp.]
MKLKILALSLAVLQVSVRGAGILPIEDFARPAKVSHMTVSPDGQCLAALRDVNGLKFVFFSDPKVIEWRGFEVGSSQLIPATREIVWYRWLGSKRLLLGISAWNLLEGTAAVDRDGSNWQPMTGMVDYGSGIRINYEPILAFEMLHSFNNNRDVLMLDERVFSGKERLYPHVMKLDSNDASGKIIVRNPGNVTDWLTDRNGIVRAGIQQIEDKSAILYRPNENSDWTKLGELEAENAFLHGFSANNASIYLSTTTEKNDCTALYAFDIEKRSLGEALLTLPSYDVEYRNSGSETGAKWSKAKGKFVYFNYVEELPGVKWLDEDIEAKMEAINRRLPDTFNLPVSFSDDGMLMLIFGRSDRNPGAYYLYNQFTRKLSPIARLMPWIEPEQMAPMKPIKYSARDGLEIHGYLTLPNGVEPTNLPLIVMPHGGPWVRDNWEFDPLVQMLANRGYAVLQMNYRGSSGYGHAFYKKGQKQVGGTIQCDIEDGTRWAIQTKLADPKRIAIVGASYGGYSALYALGKSPDLYRCGISLCGVTDWVSIFTNLDDPEYKFSRIHWIKSIGDPEADVEKLKAISPVNFAQSITAPVLIIQGKNDRIVPPKQAKKMVTALEKAGRKPQSLFLPDEGHGSKTEKGRIAEFKAIEAFLAKHLGAEKTAN